MAVAGDPGHCRARLALAAGAEIERLASVKRCALVLVEQPDVVKITAGARRTHVALQGTAGQYRLTPGVPRGQRNGFETSDVGSEECDGDAVLTLGDEASERPAYVALRTRFALHRRIGRIADQRENARLARLPQRRLVERIAHQRVAVDLPVAGVHDTPVGRLDQQRVGLGDRVRQRDEREREGPKLQPAGERNLGERNLGQQPFVTQLLPQHGGGERSRVTRDGGAGARDRRPRPDDPRGHGSARWRADPSGGPG